MSFIDVTVIFSLCVLVIGLVSMMCAWSYKTIIETRSKLALVNAAANVEKRVKNEEAGLNKRLKEIQESTYSYSRTQMPIGNFDQPITRVRKNGDK